MTVTPRATPRFVITLLAALGCGMAFAAAPPSGFNSAKLIAEGQGQTTQEYPGIDLVKGPLFIETTYEGPGQLKINILNTSLGVPRTVHFVQEKHVQRIVAITAARPNATIQIEVNDQPGHRWAFKLYQQASERPVTLPVTFDCTNHVAGLFEFNQPIEVLWDFAGKGFASMYFHNSDGHAIKAVAQRMQLGEDRKGSDVFELPGRHWFACSTGGSYNVFSGSSGGPSPIRVTIRPTDKSKIVAKKKKSVSVASSADTAVASEGSMGGGGVKTQTPKRKPPKKQPAQLASGLAGKLSERLEPKLEAEAGLGLTRQSAQQMGGVIVITWTVDKAGSGDAVVKVLERELEAELSSHSIAGITMIQIEHGKVDGSAVQGTAMVNAEQLMLSLQPK